MSEKDKNKIPGTLQGQAWKRAVEKSKPKSGTPHDWEYYEKMIGEINEQKRDDKQE